MAEQEAPSVEAMIELCVNATSIEDTRKLAGALYFRGVVDALRGDLPVSANVLVHSHGAMPILNGAQLGEILAGLASK